MKLLIPLLILASVVFTVGCKAVPMYDQNGVFQGVGAKLVDAGDPSTAESVAGQIRSVSRQTNSVAGEILNNPLVLTLGGATGLGGILEIARRTVNASNAKRREEELEQLKEQREREDRLYDEALAIGAKLPAE